MLCKVIFDKAANRMETDDPAAAARLRQATPHWMRHTGVTHAMESGASPRYVQAQARHSSLNVTAKYSRCLPIFAGPAVVLRMRASDTKQTSATLVYV